VQNPTRAAAWPDPATTRKREILEMLQVASILETIPISYLLRVSRQFPELIFHISAGIIQVKDNGSALRATGDQS
jgi:hypothetical protein